MNSPTDNTSTSTTGRSAALYQQALRVLPGGVSRNTVFRRPHPHYAASGEGCYITDLDGVQRIDFSNNMASLIHGHAHPEIVSAVSQQLVKGTAFTMATEAEVRLAELLCDRGRGFDKIRFVNSGTEAVMLAIKAARCFTGRPKIAKIEGTYHGTYDYAEVSQKPSPENWGRPERPASVPMAKGTPQTVLDDVVVIPFNDVPGAVRMLDAQAEQIACVLLDPLPHRVGLIKASAEFVQALWDWTRRRHALLVIDEVITFRSQYEGAFAWYDVLPDLTALGKIIGGGFPVGAVAGRDDVMAALDPSQVQVPLPHSGTFSANPMTMTAGLTAMKLFDRAAVDRLNQLGDRARREIAQAIADTGIEACVTGGGSLFRVHLKPEAPSEYRSAYMDAAETAQIAWLVDFLLERGFLLINTCTGALSTAMTQREIDLLVDALRDGFVQLQSKAG
jgi:glutamate-1-semialdehyde 2,1-aminomutase